MTDESRYAWQQLSFAAAYLAQEIWDKKWQFEQR
jgi:hypothetical protein